jgi:putative salt-induced outer membrane protein YdiY
LSGATSSKSVAAALLKEIEMRLSLAVLFCLSPLLADRITVKNGDRITGGIVKKDAKGVLIKSEIFGLVTIPWDQVQTISADQPVNVVLSTGETLQGRLAPQGDRVDIEGEGMKKEVPLANIATIRNAEEQRNYERLLAPGLTQLWTGAASFGFAGSQGNAKTRTLTTSFNAARTTNSDKITVYFSAIRASALVDQVLATTAQAVRGGWAYNHNVTSRLFLTGFNDYEYDRFQNLDLRVVLGGGLGFTLWKAEGGRLDVSGGGAWNRESFSPAAPEVSFTRNSGEAYFGDEFTYQVTGATALYQNARFFPNLTNTGEYRFNFDLGANTKLTRWLTWNVGLSDRFLSNPVPGRQRNDLLYTTGVGVTFAQ